MISHYCRKLNNSRFIQIQTHNNFKTGVALHFCKEQEFKEENQTQEELLHYPSTSKVSEAYKILENDSFNFKELSF
jgi:hypothetical protein